LHQCEAVYPDNYACYLDTHHGTDAKSAHNSADKPPTRQIKTIEDPIGSGFGLGYRVRVWVGVRMRFRVRVKVRLRV
jgi:hypothetical protein